MRVNGTDLSTYGAKLLRKHLESAEHLINTEWPVGALHPYMDLLVNFRYKTLTIELEFKGASSTTEANKSKFKANAVLCVLTEYGNGTNTLTGYLESDSVTEVINGYQKVEYAFKVVEEKAQVTLDLVNTGSYTTTNSGTALTPVALEFTPSANGDYTIRINADTDHEAAITINGGLSGVMRKIDAKTGIWEGTVNKFSSTTLMDFPRFKTGANTISISPATYIAKFTYKPRMV